MRCLECLFPGIAAPPREGCFQLSPSQPSLLRSGTGAVVFFLKGHPARRHWQGEDLPSRRAKANSFSGKLQTKWEHLKHKGENPANELRRPLPVVTPAREQSGGGKQK